MRRAGLLLSSSPMLLIHTHLTGYVRSYPVSTYVATVYCYVYVATYVSVVATCSVVYMYLRNLFSCFNTYAVGMKT